MSFHSGFVCILGRPNAGKSTLLNALVGEKLAIISPKPQTTRNRILGIINIPKQKGREAGQIVLIDTPGVHQSGSSLGRKMMSEVREALEGCELILMIVDAKKKWDRDDDFVLDLARKAGTSVFLLLNKIDLLADKSKLLPLIAQFQALHDFKEIVPISALKKKGLDELLSCVLKALPTGVWQARWSPTTGWWKRWRRRPGTAGTWTPSWPGWARMEEAISFSVRSIPGSRCAPTAGSTWRTAKTKYLCRMRSVLNSMPCRRHFENVG